MRDSFDPRATRAREPRATRALSRSLLPSPSSLSPSSSISPSPLSASRRPPRTRRAPARRATTALLCLAALVALALGATPAAADLCSDCRAPTSAELEADDNFRLETRTVGVKVVVARNSL
jgi:hypothetical protein